MSRGGRGGGRGGRKGPDLSFDDSEPSTSGSKKPAPIFPRVDFPVPKPFDATEVASVQSYISYRTKLRNGPLYSILDPSSLTNDKGKVDQRAGFNPFNNQETYTAKSLPKKRTIPDVISQNPALQFFPKELWHIIDPKRKHPLWKTADGQLIRPRKRKRPGTATAEQSQPQNDEEQNSDEDSDVVVTGQRRHNAAKSRRTDPTSKSAKQKQGLDAEDDYPDADPNEDEDVGADDAPEDSEFDDSDDEGDDYNAEQYFDGGDDDDFAGDDGGEDETYG